MAAEKDKKQVMDVAKPGKAPATPTARPIIVGHGSIMKDPMVTDTSVPAATEVQPVAEQTTPTPPTSPAPPSASKRIIQPLSSGTPTPESPAEEKPAGDATDDDPDTSSKQSDASEIEDASNEEAVVDAVVGQATSKKKLGELSEEDKQRQELVERLVAEKTYFVPIGQVARRHRRYAIAAILVILLLIAGATAYAYYANVFPFASKDSVEKVQSSVSPQVPTQKPVVTPKLTSYTSKELGISFSYPQEWGVATEILNTQETTERGKRVLVAFAAQPKVLIGAKAATWRDTAKDVMRICKQPGFTAYTVEKTALDNGTRVVSEKSDRQVIERLEGGLCGDVRMTGNIKFAKNTTYAGVSIDYIDSVTDSLDLAQRIADYKKNYDKYFPDALRQQVIALTTSVSEQ